MDNRFFLLFTCLLVLFSGQPSRAQQQLLYSSVSDNATVSLGQRAGSIVVLQRQPGVLPLSIRQAVELGLANNLGILLRKEGVQSAKGQEWVALSRLLPNLVAEGSLHHQKENLAITGMSLPNVPSVAGPFDYYDAHVSLRQRIFDLEAIERWRSAAHEVTAADFSEKDARELVVVAVGAAYLQTLAAQARVDTVKSQVNTARTILDRAVAMHQQGISPGIDELRARVELLTRNQQLIVAENDLAKQKLSLIRLIGVPVGQEIELTEDTNSPKVPAGVL